MQFLIIVAIICFLGVTYSFAKEPKAFNLLNGIVGIGALFVLTGIENFKSIGVISILTGITLTSVYLLYRTDLNNKQRYLGSFSGIILLWAVVPKLMHWPGGGIGSLFCIVPVILAIFWLLSKAEKDSRFFSPLIIIIPICLSEFIRFTIILLE